MASDPRRNHLLASLPDAEWQRWLPLLERVELPYGRTLHAPGVAVEQVYFPTTAIVALLRLLDDGGSSAVAVVGNEGVVGVSAFLGGGSAPGHAVVQVAGEAFRVGAQMLRDELNRSDPLMRRLLRYTQALMIQMAQTAACNRHHSLEQLLCRWLMLCLDRLQGNVLEMTQESIAVALGVRREGVGEAAHRLQEAGLIRYTRGHIAVLDRRGLQGHTCECYTAITSECDRLLPVTATA
jgi:CRP-like cAMP-binding protein